MTKPPILPQAHLPPLHLLRHQYPFTFPLTDCIANQIAKYLGVDGGIFEKLLAAGEEGPGGAGGGRDSQGMWRWSRKPATEGSLGLGCCLPTG